MRRKLEYTGTTITIKNPKDELYGTAFPVAEAPASILLRLLPEDIKCAKPDDGAHCAFANAARRQYGAERVKFDFTTAYLLFLKGDGGFGQKLRCDTFFRFMLPCAVMRAIKDFDQEGNTMPGGYEMIAPTKGRTVIAAKERAKKSRLLRASSGKSKNYPDTHASPSRTIRGGVL